MKKSFPAILSLVCVLAMLFTLLPAAFAEEDAALPEIPSAAESDEGESLPDSVEDGTVPLDLPADEQPESVPEAGESGDTEAPAAESGDGTEEPVGDVIVSDPIVNETIVCDEPAEGEATGSEAIVPEATGDSAGNEVSAPEVTDNEGKNEATIPEETEVQTPTNEDNTTDEPVINDPEEDSGEKELPAEPAEEEPAPSEPAEEEPGEESNPVADPDSGETDSTETVPSEPAGEAPADEPTGSEPEQEEPSSTNEEQAPTDEEQKAAEENTENTESVNDITDSEEQASEIPAEAEPTEETIPEEPASEEPADEEPAAEEPITEESDPEEPAADESVLEAPASEDPVANEPDANEPATDQPVADEPADEEPTQEEPVEEPVAEEPADESPAEITPPEIKVDAKEAAELVLSPEKQKVSIIAEEAGPIRLILDKAPGLAVFLEKEKLEPVETDLTDKIVWELEAEKGKNEVFIQADAESTVNAKAIRFVPAPETQDTVETAEPEPAPVRRVKLVSTLDGLKEVEAGTEIVMTAELIGFTEDEIAAVTWQYRPAGENDFHDIPDAHGLTWSYEISAANIHYEWRILLTLKP